MADILYSIERILAVTQVGEVSLDSADTMDVVVRRLEVIGEAAATVPIEFRDAYPGIPWKGMKGFRNIASHEYWNLDRGLIWAAVGQLPLIREQLRDANPRAARRK